MAAGPQVKVEKHADDSLNHQLYHQIVESIVQGVLKPGQRLTPSRDFAEELGISRTTVRHVYDRLLKDGYLESRGRYGTFVNTELPQRRPPSSKHPKAARAVRAGRQSGEKLLSSYALTLKKLPEFQPQRPDLKYPFYSWRVAYQDFPHEDWARLLGRLARQRTRAMVNYPDDPRGLKALREAIAKNLWQQKGIRCIADQVIIVSGYQQGLDMIIRLHLNAGDAMVVENPGYPWVWDAVAAAGAKLVAVNVDESGLDTDELQKVKGKIVKLVYVSPSHQFPTGALMSAARRMALLNWASDNEVLIVEDEHDSDYHYESKAIPALKSLDQLDNVIYAGTFAKVLFPAIGAAYLVVPEELSGLYARARTLASEQPPLLLQKAIAEWIEEGMLEKHVRKMHAVYLERRNAILKALLQEFGTRARIKGESGGMHILVEFNSRLKTQDIVQRAMKEGIGLVDTRSFYKGKSKEREFVMGYCDLAPREIREGIAKLRKVVLD